VTSVRPRHMDFSVELLQSIINNKTKPPGSLGAIEELALQIGIVQQSVTPEMNTCQLTIFAADHGIVESGVSAYPKEVTQQMLLNFLSGGAAANVFARTHGVDVQVVDAGVSGEPLIHDDLLSRRIGPGTANSENKPAMTRTEFDAAIMHGRALGGSGEYDARCFGEMGIGNTSAATLVCHKILNLPLAELTGRGTGLDDKGLEHKLAVLQRAAARTSDALDAKTAMQEYGGFEIAMMTGAMMGAADAGTLVIVDGFIATAAAVTAIKLRPAIQQAMVFAHRSAEAGHTAVIQELGIKPLLALDMRLGEGTGALLAWPLVKSAAAMLNEMASFESAGVSGPA
jgi:nicotinate-nucleotide--dimethylbenzimidazole phosphoribosyltransferase